MSSKGQPTVSVIMPVRNEADYVARGLSAVLVQDYPNDKLEVIVVDGDSDDGTREIIQEVLMSHPRGKAVAVTVSRNPRRWVPASLNLALRNSRGEVIVRIDGHCEVPPEYLSRCVEALESSGADCAGGVLETVGEGLVGSAIAAAQGSSFGVGNARFRYAKKAGWVDTLAFGAYRREVFDRLGEFDEELVRNQDDEMNFRLVSSGGRIWLDPRISVVYRSRQTLSALWRQYFEYGVYKVRVMQKRRGAASWRHFVPSAFVVALAVSVGLSVVTGRHQFVVLVAGTYGAASIAAAIAAIGARSYLAPVVVVAFLTMHIAYGVGFIAGIWRWRRHMREVFTGGTRVPETT